jgi:two-component system OmpR family response regulator
MTNTTTITRKSTKKILAVDDDGEIGLVLDMILDDNEYQLDYVDSILSANEYLEKSKPSLIILDNKLPDGFGVDFISYVRNKYPSIKIIMMSGFASVRDVALENGAAAFFEKPFSLDEFNETIDRLLH